MKAPRAHLLTSLIIVGHSLLVETGVRRGKNPSTSPIVSQEEPKPEPDWPTIKSLSTMGSVSKFAEPYSEAYEKGFRLRKEWKISEFQAQCRKVRKSKKSKRKRRRQT